MPIIQLREGGVVVLFGRSRPRLNWLFPSCQCPFKGHETAWPTFNWNIDLKEETEMIELKKAFTSIITLKIPPVLKTLIFLIILKTLTLLRTLHNFWQWKQLILRHLSRVRYISGNVLGVKGDVYRTLLTNFFMRWEVLTFVTHTN